ncbi:MAG: CBS domain-containing protein [Cyanobacteria bacterium]|nr:CBS domain-containing protein [Cyanobacteriota bacterium]
MKASDIMTSNVVTIRGAATVADAIELMRSRSLRALIVNRRHDRDAYGIVTETDIVYKVVAYGTDPKTVRVHEIMTKPCIVVNADLEVEYIARLFANTGIRRAPVIDGRLVGIVSVSDILNKSQCIEQPKSIMLADRIEQAIAEARQICADKGPGSKECASAWDSVEELQAEAAHQQAKPLIKTAFEEYCEENPAALEARVYDV